MARFHDRYFALKLAGQRMPVRLVPWRIAPPLRLVVRGDRQSLESGRARVIRDQRRRRSQQAAADPQHEAVYAVLATGRAHIECAARRGDRRHACPVRLDAAAIGLQQTSLKSKRSRRRDAVISGHGSHPASVAVGVPPREANVELADHERDSHTHRVLSSGTEARRVTTNLRGAHTRLSDERP
ncbi:hypothetical protein ACFPRL_06020 [Pseudoclavibacter helvolus]